MFTEKELNVIYNIAEMAYIQYRDSNGEIDYARYEDKSPELLENIMYKAVKEAITNA